MPSDFAQGPPEDQTAYNYSHSSQGHYDDFRMAVAVKNRQGVLQLPVADGSNECDLIAVHDPISVKVVTWTATRNGVPPEAPDPKKVLPNHTLLDSCVAAAVPTPNPDGLTKSYTMTGEYIYANKKEEPPGTALKPGASPVTNVPPGSNTYGAVLFRPDLLDG